MVPPNTPDGDAVQDGLSLRPAARSSEFGGLRRHPAIHKYVDMTHAISEHPMPALIVGTVAEDVLSNMTISAVPSLDHDATLQLAADTADGPHIFICNANIPLAYPEVQRSALDLTRAFSIGRKRSRWMAEENRRRHNKPSYP